MSHYGVRRLIAINSGGFIYAELDLSKPVHLVAPNNRGKSTLVNALQFLYVDDIAKMVFGRRTAEDTKRHYFGHDPSYLIFECATPSGIQCLLVRGLGHLRNFAFERFVYQREYQRQDFEDEHRRVASFDTLRGRLANRRLLEAPAKQSYWEILSGQSSTDGEDVPHLAILPLKKIEEYRAFREVFVSLLKLSNMDGRNLQELIIACHAREITEQRIDIAADYKAEFERAERAEQDAAFVRAVRDDIDRGGTLRSDEAAILAQVSEAGPQVIGAARQCQAALGQHQAQLASTIVQRTREKGAKEKEQFELERETGKLEERLRVARDDVEVLEKEHTKWSAYSPLKLQSLRDKIETLEDRIAQLRQNLQRNQDPATLKAQVERLERQLTQERDALKHWDKTAFTALRTLGMSEPRLLWTFRLLNPSLLNLIVGQTLTIKNENALLANLESLRERIERNIYSDQTVEANLESVAGPDLVAIKNKEYLRSQISINEQNLAQARDQLKIAEDQALARKELDAKTAEHKNCQEELSGHENHMQAWQKRAEVDARVKQVDERLVVVSKTAAAVRQEVEDLGAAIRKLQEQDGDLGKIRGQLQASLKYLDELMTEVRLELPPLAEDVLESEALLDTVEALAQRAEGIRSQLTALSVQVRRIHPLREQLQTIENLIAKKSGQSGTQPIYFNDREEEWRLLLEKRDSLDSLEQVSKRQWDALFTTLGARLNGIRLGMRAIEQAVTRINGGLKRYRVSNLKEVQLKVEKSADTYPMVEALTSMDSIFQNRDQIEAAKDRLRIMIQSTQPIELHSLFALHIRVQQNDGQWMEARSLDEIGSTGTGMTTKAMIFIQLVRAIVGNERYRLHFYMDETGHLDDRNLYATTSMAMSKGILPITAEPAVRIDPLAHPEVTVYALGQDGQGRFYIEACNTYRAARTDAENVVPTEASHG